MKPDPRSIDAMEAACQRSNCGHRWIDHDPTTSWFGCLAPGCQCVSYRTNGERERLLYPGGENDPSYALAPRLTEERKTAILDEDLGRRARMTAVTVVVPTIPGRERLLHRALDSIWSQTFQDLEVWVMPDGVEYPIGPDWVIEGRTRTIPLGRHWGHWGAEQKLVAGYLCQTEFMAYLHDDDYWLPRHLDLLVAALRGSGRDFAYSKIDWCGTVIGTDPPEHAQIDTGCIVHRTELLRKSTWDPAGGYALDWELVERWMKAGATWAFVPEVTLIYPEKREGR